ncbi:PREDICTED: probable serine/threonine-protein kinase DDB_G0283337 [Papilio polytes]|uniref:probable serine/threonine-protein kinase DDB_G0283337 n=1 Tax=Papilio polytes TaxID=76194 RepID=UPI0006765DE3|nr:PREDICTED: probable serine/threonine-protein kinase DDB_G0283337 [Papilio polytes]
MDIQQSSETDTACLMKKYNFVKPVTVTVIYEEDEEKVKEINIDDSNNSMINQEGNKLPLRSNASKKSDETNTEYVNSKIKDNYSMLLTLAQNMSNIVKAYYDYIQSLKRNANKAVNLKFKYIHTKSENYRRSFNVTYRLLVPHKANARVKQFLIQKIIELSKVNIDSTFVLWLYYDIIFWTEGIKDKILTQSQFDNVNQVCNLPSRLFGKAQNGSNKLKRKSDPNNCSKENKITIFSAGPKGNEIILKVDAQYAHTASQKNEFEKVKNSERENSEKNITSINKSTNSINELNHPLPINTQSSQTHFVNLSKGFNNDNLSNVNNVITNDVDPFIRRLENIDNSNKVAPQIDNIIAQNRPNQEQDTMPREIGESHSVSFQALIDDMNSAIYSQTSKTEQRTSHNISVPNFFPTYRTNNGISTQDNRNNLTTSQNQIQTLNQNIYPPQNTNSDNMDNCPTNMPLQYNSGTNHLPLRTNLHYPMITMNENINQNYERNYIITSNYQENYCNRSLVDQGQQTNKQYLVQNTISRDSGFTTPVSYNYSPPQMNLAAFQDRSNWFNI